MKLVLFLFSVAMIVGDRLVFGDCDSKLLESCVNQGEADGPQDECGDLKTRMDCIEISGCLEDSDTHVRWRNTANRDYYQDRIKQLGCSF